MVTTSHRAEWRRARIALWHFDDAMIARLAADYGALGHWDRPLKVGPGAAYYSGSSDLARTVNLGDMTGRAG